MPTSRRRQWGLVAAGMVVITGGVGVALVEWLHLPKASIWVVVGATVALAWAIRTMTARK